MIIYFNVQGKILLIPVVKNPAQLWHWWQWFSFSARAFLLWILLTFSLLLFHVVTCISYVSESPFFSPFTYNLLVCHWNVNGKSSHRVIFPTLRLQVSWAPQHLPLSHSHVHQQFCGLIYSGALRVLVVGLFINPSCIWKDNHFNVNIQLQWI